MKNFILVFVILIINTSILAQEQYQLNKIIPPSPTAASLGAYGDIPVSYYTGTPEIEIPIYEIKTNNYSLPIKLQYNASGVKVNNDASWVGLGWSLLAGGVITRTVRQKDDFDYSIGYYYTSTLPERHDNSEDYTASDVDYIADLYRGSKDGEPDLFFYNFGSYSGKFVMSKLVDGGDAFQAKQDNLEIKFDKSPNNPLGQWIVTSPDGYRYYFKTPEITNDWYGSNELVKYYGLSSFSGSSVDLVTSWYLDRIVSPFGEEVIFTYETGQSLSSFSFSRKRYDQLDWAIGSIGNGVPVTGSENPLGSHFSYFYISRQHIADVYLKKIDFQNGYLVFNRSQRDDIEPYPYANGAKPEKLDEIIVYNVDDVLIKKIVFDHSYFTNPYNPVGYGDKRLKLNRVLMYDDQNELMPYDFEYYEPDKLPYKYSTMVDDWGFYIGESKAGSAPTLSGETTPTTLSSVLVDDKYFDGFDNQPDKTGEYSLRGIITSITYPTKGTTKFTFEPNDYSNLDNSNNFESSPQVTEAFSDPDMGEYKLSTQLTLTESSVVKFIPYAYLIDGNDWLTNEQFGTLKNSNGTIIHSFNLTNGQTNLVLPVGIYTLTVDVLNNYYTAVEVHYDLKVPITNKIGGGVRIKTITNYDSDEKKIRAKKFLYIDESGLSTGKLISKIYSSYTEPAAIELITDDAILTVDADYVVRQSGSLWPIGISSLGNTIGYSKVTVLEDENTEIGSTEYNYHNLPIQVLPGIPGIPPITDTQNGQIESQIIKDYSGIILKKISYDYDMKESISIKGLKAYRPAPAEYVLYNGITITEYDFYDNLSEWWIPREVREDNYFGNKILTTSNINHFDNSVYKQITSKETNFSDATSLLTTFKYPYDFNGQLPYTEMVQNHLISPVVEKSSYRNSVHLETVKVNYMDWGNNIIAPLSVESKQGSNNFFETRLHYNAYDVRGNILSFAKQNDFERSYIWGYNQSYPIAEAFNASMDKIAFTSFESSTDMGNWAYDETKRIESYSRTGTNCYQLYNAPITKNLLSDTYKLEFWSKGTVSVTGTNATLINSSVHDIYGWILYEWLINANTNDILKISSTTSAMLIDDVRIYPKNSKLTTYTYIPNIGMTSSTDESNISTFYDYDTFGRVKFVRDNDKNYVKVYDYSFKK